VRKIILGLTGASGACYAKRLVEVLSPQVDLHLVHSRTAPLVFHEELGLNLSGWLKEQKVTVHGISDFLSPLASGSNRFDGYVVIPCSMKTLSQIAHGVGETLLTRVGDIALKERRKMILVAREAPYSTVHLENMLRISQMGGIIFPASPGFYHDPQTIEDLVDFVVSRVIQLLDLPQELVKPWKS
jgi:4-hydroxy-3-polyprenylbenzoate decarboxylase